MHELPSNILLLCRCKRMHPLQAASVNIMHFSQYLEEQGPIPDALLRDMKHLNEGPSADFLQELEGSQAYKSFMSQYMSYRQETLNGSHGSTAQFWLTYVNLVHVFLLFNRACRTNNLELFIYALDITTDVFFATNRPNYSRWMVLYVLRLLNIDHTHPGLRHVLEGGALSVRRTTKQFSRWYNTWTNCKLRCSIASHRNSFLHKCCSREESMDGNTCCPHRHCFKSHDKSWHSSCRRLY